MDHQIVDENHIATLGGDFYRRLPSQIGDQRPQITHMAIPVMLLSDYSSEYVV